MNKKLVIGIVLIAIMALVTLSSVVLDIGLVVAGHFAWNVTYQREVHSHMDNAYYADTPDLMKTELVAAVNSMHRLGLEGYYDSMYPPSYTPDHNMNYQYAHLESVIQRCDDVIKWRQTDGQGTQATDVYEQKMQALRSFIHDTKQGGWSDDIAQGAYMVKNHAFVSFWWDFGVWIFFGWVAFAAATLGVGIPLANIGYNEVQKSRQPPRNNYRSDNSYPY